ncbi:MAG: cache domain-containing protein [Burkholderiales bacterium]|nr:cache domain-containing protein [Burkholderiales bacterium]
MSILVRLTKPMSLRWRILLPLMAGLILLVAVFAAVLFAVERAHFKEDLEMPLQRDSMALRGDKLAALGEALAQDPDLRRALATGDRQHLLKHAAPIFQGIRQDFNITHFYFHDAERQVLLRVHDPASFGDRIERFTAREAERTGRATVGMELGKAGTYTLRAVVPVKEGGRLIGYIELGEEVLDSLIDLSKAFKVDGYVLLYKTHLIRKDWEQFMRALGRTPDWDHYPDMVLAAQTRPEVPAFLVSLFGELKQGTLQQMGKTVKSGGETYNIGHLPLQDTEDREVGRLVMLRNVTAISSQTSRELLWVVFTAVLGGAVLSVFFFFHLRRTEGELSLANAQVAEAAVAREAEQRRHIEELSGRINELERFERLTVGRELRIQALREENRHLRAALGMEADATPTGGEGDGHGG